MRLNDLGAAGAPETHAIETKALSRDSDARAGHSELMAAFAAFREANDARLDELERKQTADVLTEEKVARINRALTEQKAALDSLAVEIRRPAFGASPREGNDFASRERKGAFERYVRRGETHELARLEMKALSAGSDPDGGYLVPAETEAAIDRTLSAISPIRAISRVRQIGANVLKKPVSNGGFDAGWVGETAARPQTASAQFHLLEFPAMELYAMPAATQTLLDDAYVNIEQWLAEEVQSEFAQQEGVAFVSGDGTNKPKGFLSYTKVANASWVWGQTGFILSGAAGGFAASNPSDRLIDLIYSARQAYRARGRFVMNRNTEAAIRKFKDADGNYLWQPGASAGSPATLAGYPVTEADDMPDIAADSFSIAFGDFERGYLVVDRAGVRILRDPYSAKPYVLFYMTKRVGGGIQDFDAIKLMKFAAS